MQDTDSYTYNSKKSLVRVEGVGHKLYMDNFFSSPDIYKMICAQEVSTIGGLSEKTVKEHEWALTRRH